VGLEETSARDVSPNGRCKSRDGAAASAENLALAVPAAGAHVRELKGDRVDKVPCGPGPNFLRLTGWKQPPFLTARGRGLAGRASADRGALTRGGGMPAARS
jgi:hypothetical protein